jgi:hypothetical protein
MGIPDSQAAIVNPRLQDSRPRALKFLERQL